MTCDNVDISKKVFVVFIRPSILTKLWDIFIHDHWLLFVIFKISISRCRFLALFHKKSRMVFPFSHYNWKMLSAFARKPGDYLCIHCHRLPFVFDFDFKLMTILRRDEAKVAKQSCLKTIFINMMIKTCSCVIMYIIFLKKKWWIVHVVYFWIRHWLLLVYDWYGELTKSLVDIHGHAKNETKDMILTLTYHNMWRTSLAIRCCYSVPIIENNTYWERNKI